MRSGGTLGELLRIGKQAHQTFLRNVDWGIRTSLGLPTSRPIRDASAATARRVQIGNCKLQIGKLQIANWKLQIGNC